MVRSEWLSECLRVGSRQPFESHLLDTVTLTTVSKFAKRNTAAAAAAARSAAGGGGLQNAVINPCWNWPVFQKANGKCWIEEVVANLAESMPRGVVYVDGMSLKVC